MSDYEQPPSSFLADFDPVLPLNVTESTDRRWPVPKCFKGAFTASTSFTIKVDSFDNELAITLNGQLVAFLANPSFGGYPSSFGPKDFFANLAKGKNILILSLSNNYAGGDDRNPSSAAVQIYIDGAFKEFKFSSFDQGSAAALRQGLIAQAFVEITKS